MAADEKDLAYYLENPEELPEHYSIEQLTELAEGKAAEVEEVEVVEAEVQSEVESAPDGTETVAEAPVDEEAPIQSKDGKHTIPYSVLSKEREQRRAAEAAIQELQERMVSLEKGTTPAAEVGESVVTDEELTALREDFPALAGTLEKLLGKVTTLETQLTEERTRTTTERAQTAQTTVQDSIDANPTLSYWQTENTKMFETAVRFDELLMADPDNSSLTLDERFVKVVAAVEAVHGKAKLPAAFVKGDEPDKQALAESVKKAVEKVPAPKAKTLSDIPGGMPPKADETENIAEMSPNRLNAMMDKMSPDQIADLLAKFG